MSQRDMPTIEDIIEKAVSGYNDSLSTAPQARTRFCYPITMERAYSLLMCAYKNAVEERVPTFQDDAETPRRMQSIANWLTNPARKPSLLLTGGLTGTGKTTAAKALKDMARGLKESFDSNKIQAQMSREAGAYVPLSEDAKSRLSWCESRVIVPVMFTANDIARMAEDQGGGYDGATRAPFLIIDDLGTEQRILKRYGNEILPLTDLLLFRYENMLPTVITTNLSHSQIAEQYGPRISDRIKEMCETLVFTQTESYRR